MLSFLADENFNMHIINGVMRRLPDADIVRVQDAGLESADEEILLLAECSTAGEWEGQVNYLPLK